jgi:hypothetical protein
LTNSVCLLQRLYYIAQSPNLYNVLFPIYFFFSSRKIGAVSLRSFSYKINLPSMSKTEVSLCCRVISSKIISFWFAKRAPVYLLIFLASLTCTPINNLGLLNSSFSFNWLAIFCKMVKELSLFVSYTKINASFLCM